jgi:hypothetical protein
MAWLGCARRLLAAVRALWPQVKSAITGLRNQLQPVWFTSASDALGVGPDGLARRRASRRAKLPIVLNLTVPSRG